MAAIGSSVPSLSVIQSGNGDAIKEKEGEGRKENKRNKKKRKELRASSGPRSGTRSLPGVFRKGSRIPQGE